MFTPFIVAIIAAAATVFQIAFLSHLAFPWSTVSFPIVAVAYGVAKDRPLLALGWALVGGILLDLHGILGFGSELFALFFAFFVARYLFLRVLTNAGAAAIFLLGAVTAFVHWLALAAIDGVGVLFGSVPIMVDLSAAAAFAPLRQALVTGLALLLVVAAQDAVGRRFRKTFISHAASSTFS